MAVSTLWLLQVVTTSPFHFQKPVSQNLARNSEVIHFFRCKKWVTNHSLGWANIEPQLGEVMWSDSPRISAGHKFKYISERWDARWRRVSWLISCVVWYHGSLWSYRRFHDGPSKRRSADPMERFEWLILHQFNWFPTNLVLFQLTRPHTRFILARFLKIFVKISYILKPVWKTN